MSKLTNPSHLQNSQYSNSSNLYHRAYLHQRYSTNKTGWHSWVLSVLELHPGDRILEIGCGPGYLWQAEKNQLPPGSLVVLTDLSEGMIQEARQALSQKENFLYGSASAISLPFRDEYFDCVIANHMLYHVPDVPRALQEINRVLRPAAKFYAATNGKSHLQEIHNWRSEFFPGADSPDWVTPTANFSLQNGAELLGSWFKRIDLHPYPDQLKVTEVQPVLNYINSYLPEEQGPAAFLDLKSYLKQEIAQYGWLRITKETGMFMAEKAG